MSVREENRRAAARYLAQGYSASETAQRVGKTPATVRRWQEDPTFQTYIQEAADSILKQASIGMTNILLTFPDLVDKALAIAQDGTHRDQGNMLRYCIDKVLVPRTRQEVSNTHTFDVTFTEQVSEGITQLQSVMQGVGPRNPTLKSGKEAIETYGITAGSDAHAENESLEAGEQP